MNIICHNHGGRYNNSTLYYAFRIVVENGAGTGHTFDFPLARIMLCISL
jgi:hypothetical protein